VPRQKLAVHSHEVESILKVETAVETKDCLQAVTSIPWTQLVKGLAASLKQANFKAEKTKKQRKKSKSQPSGVLGQVSPEPTLKLRFVQRQKPFCIVELAAPLISSTVIIPQ